MSLPSWERGLKLLKMIILKYREIVAPFVGAWIEILVSRGLDCHNKSLPSWERGLKYVISFCLNLSNESLPSWERGLKYQSQLLYLVPEESLPSWERGLKFPEPCPILSVFRRSLRGSVD